MAVSTVGCGRNDDQAPEGRKKMSEVLPSLAGLISFAHDDPAMNRRAIFGRPAGTWIQGSI